MPAGTCVKMNGLTASATTREVEEFMMYCGKIISVVLSADRSSLGGYSAVVEFEERRSVEIAELLSGAVFQRHEIHIAPIAMEAVGGEALKPAPVVQRGMEVPDSYGGPQVLRHALVAFGNLQGRHLISGCRGIFDRIHERVRRMDNSLPAAPAPQVVNSVGGMRPAAGTGATVEQWDCMYSQPQWGRKSE